MKGDTDTAASYSWKQSCAVFFDAVGYSSKIEVSHEETRRKLVRWFDELTKSIEGSGGRVIDTAGDGVFAEFSDVADAVLCANAFHDLLDVENQSVPIDRRMRFRCGIAYGQVMQEEHLISGPTVNIAARLQQLAEPGATNINSEAHRQVSGDERFYFSDIGFRILKGLTNPVRVWRVVDANKQVISPSSALAAEYGSALEQDESGVNTDPRGIAVLPFEVPPGKDMSEEEDAYMALGMAADIADGLARSHWLKVISPRSSMNYSDSSYEANQVARELGIRYLLKGRMRTAGTRVRVSSSLIDCVTEHTVWSENFDRQEDSIFDIQDEITQLIVAKIEPEFLRHESELAADNRPRDLNAWELLMRARWHFWRGTAKHVEMALGCGEKALQLDPNNSQTLALVSFCHMTQVWTGVSKDPKFQSAEALRFARQAVNLDETNANAHFTLGTALSINGEIRPAIAAERRALELNPNMAGALGELARLYAFDGQAEAARRAGLKAIELSPSDPHISLFVRSLAVAAFVERDFQKAVDLAREAAAKRPDWFFHHAMVAACEALDGNIADAQYAMAECNRLVPHYPKAVLKTGHPFSRAEDFEKFLEGLHLAGWNED